MSAFTGLILRNSSGSLLQQGKVTDISTTKATKNAHIPLPGANNDVIQNFGRMNRKFSIKGWVLGTVAIDFLEALPNTTGSFFFSSSAINAVLINKVVVLYTELQWSDKGTLPMQRDFSLSFVELI